MPLRKFALLLKWDFKHRAREHRGRLAWRLNFQGSSINGK